MSSKRQLRIPSHQQVHQRIEQIPHSNLLRSLKERQDSHHAHTQRGNQRQLCIIYPNHTVKSATLSKATAALRQLRDTDHHQQIENTVKNEPQ